jgi:hypothetical protein
MKPRQRRKEWNLAPFVLSLLMASGAAAQDASFYGLFKEQRLQQTGEGPPTLRDPPFRFNSFVDASAPNRVTGASLKLPGGGLRTLSLDPDGGSANLEEDFATKAALDAPYPAGTYVLTINTVSQGAKTIVLSLPADAYPNDPHLANFTPAQAINPQTDFTLQWDPFAGGATSDYVQVEVSDNQDHTLFESGPPGAPDGLNGTSTSFVLPAGTLNAGQSYRVRLMFVKVLTVDTTSYPGVMGVAGYMKTTRFNIAASSGTAGDVEFFLIDKKQFFIQTSSGSPVVDSAGPVRFDVEVAPATASSVLSASLRLPNATVKDLTQTQFDREFFLKEYFQNPAALDTAYPAGVYTLTINTASQGAKTVSLTLPSAIYPAAPRVSNFDAAQAVNPGADFAVQWDTFPGGGPDDFILLQIKDATGFTVHQSPEPGSPGALTGAATGWVIPRNTLLAGRTYSARLEFTKIVTVDNTLLAGATGVVLFASRTAFDLRTAGAGTGPDVRTYRLFKGQHYVQTGAGEPVLAEPTPYEFSTEVEMALLQSVASVSLRLPNNQIQPLRANETDFSLHVEYASLAALESAFPSGNYTFTISTAHDGVRTPTLPLAGDTYPPAPRLLNLEAAQQVDPESDFTLTWAPFTGGGASDYVRLELWDTDTDETVFETKSPGEPGALDGAATSILIPRNSLSAGRTYEGSLIFAKFTSLDTTSYPGANGVSGYYKSTEFTLTTKGALPPTPPRLSDAQMLAKGAFSFRVNGDAPREYRVEASQDLATWETVLLTNAPAATFDVLLAAALGDSHRFFRVAIGEPATGLRFNHYADGGDFGSGFTPATSFPVMVGCYRANFRIRDETGFPPANQVTFTGPAGSLLANTPAEFLQPQSQSTASYQSPCVNQPSGAPAGTYRIGYRGTTHTFSAAPQGASHLVVPLPTVTVSGGLLTKVSWSYRTAGGAPMVVPEFITWLQVQIQDRSGNRVYDSDDLPVAATSHTLPQPLEWSSIERIYMAYNDTSGDHYVIIFDHN